LIEHVRVTSKSVWRRRQLLPQKKPVVIAGGGVTSAAASAALARLQEAVHLPVFTTNMGKGAVDEMHSLSAGVLGALVGPRSLGRRTKAIVEEADLVILVGTRTNQNGTDSWRQISPGARAPTSSDAPLRQP